MPVCGTDTSLLGILSLPLCSEGWNPKQSALLIFILYTTLITSCPWNSLQTHNNWKLSLAFQISSRNYGSKRKSKKNHSSSSSSSSDSSSSDSDDDKRRKGIVKKVSSGLCKNVLQRISSIESQSYLSSNDPPTIFLWSDRVLGKYVSYTLCCYLTIQFIDK